MDEIDDCLPVVFSEENTCTVLIQTAYIIIFTFLQPHTAAAAAAINTHIVTMNIFGGSYQEGIRVMR